MHRILALILMFSLFIQSCTLLRESCDNMDFQRFLSADRVVIRTNLNQKLRETTDSQEIETIAEFAIAHSDNWSTPLYSTPVARVGANFYKDEKFIGDLGVGQTFLTSQGCGYFQRRKLSVKDRDNIMTLFRVEEPYEK